MEQMGSKYYVKFAIYQQDRIFGIFRQRLHGLTVCIQYELKTKM
jgi:hypothetical protein